MVTVVAIVVIALAFDYINGFHDAANSIATVVGTRAMSPGYAVLMAASLNFVGALAGHEVAATVGKGVIEATHDPATLEVVLAGLTGAIVWNLITWFYGLPSSSSHALVGGLIGAGFCKGGSAVIQSGVAKTALFIVISPVLGMLLGGSLMVLMSWLLHRGQPGRIDRWFRRLQFVSSALFSLGHGANDAQKTMGIIMAMLIAKGQLGAKADVPLWVILSCQLAMGLGTLSGGWRIVKTMGMRLTKLKPIGGFCAETGAASMLFLASALGVPVSTTHTITGGIVGVGSAQRMSAVRWGVARRVVWAWVLTIPGAAIVAALAYWIVAAF